MKCGYSPKWVHPKKMITHFSEVFNLHSALVLTHFGIFRQTHVTKGSKQYK